MGHTHLIVEHEYPKARIQDRERLVPTPAGSIAFARKIDEAAACMYVLQREVLAGQESPCRVAAGSPIGADVPGPLALLLGLALTLLAACSSAKRAAAADCSHPVTLAVMVFNIEYGGDQVEFGKVAEAIKAGGADVVGIEEAEGQMPHLAEQLGWQHYDERLQVVSRFPLLDPPGGDGVYTFVEVRPGCAVAMANVHLPSDPYGPELVRDGRPPEEVLSLERTRRLPAIRRQLEVLPRLARAGMPVFLTGDFNAPSHRDWTPAAVGTRAQVKFGLQWPVSSAVEEAGFRDSYREVHPDPLANPGLTWFARRPHAPRWNPDARDPQDRIDLVYAAGAARVISSRIVGESGLPAVDVAVSPWPSDHRAVVSTFMATPAALPVLVAVQRRLVAAGDPLRITFHAPANAGAGIVLVRRGGQPTSAALAEKSTTGASPERTLVFPTAGLTPGAFEAVLVDSSNAALATSSFWVRARDARPAIETAKRTYKVGEPIEATWRGAPGNRWDWVAIYEAGAGPTEDKYLLWRHINARIEGSVTLDGAAEGSGWPLRPGQYDLYLLRDDGYALLAASSFGVQP